MAENVRVEIGFVGGGTTSATLSDAAWKKLLKAVGSGEEGVLELASEAGDLFVRSSQVAFMRVLSKEARVGF